MTEYIEREAAIDAIMNVYVRTAGYKARERVFEAKEAVHRLPVADVAPVVHGRWIEQEDPMLDVYYTCSACKEDFYIETTGYTEKDLFLYTYCPNCGAKMDGGNENDRKRAYTGAAGDAEQEQESAA